MRLFLPLKPWWRETVISTCHVIPTTILNRRTRVPLRLPFTTTTHFASFPRVGPQIAVGIKKSRFPMGPDLRDVDTMFPDPRLGSPTRHEPLHAAQTGRFALRALSRERVARRGFVIERRSPSHAATSRRRFGRVRRVLGFVSAAVPKHRPKTR